jgi:hypothetical protein
MKLLQKIIPWIVFALFAYFLVGNNYNAKLGMIDDHEIPMYLGNDKTITLHEIPTIIANTEVGKWGSSVRYRPSYFITRTIETALWRDNASLWYLARFLMLILSLWIGWTLLSVIFPTTIAYISIFYLMTLNFWPDILTRLGPAEIYAVPFTLIFLLGIKSNRPLLVTLGYLISIGTKENLLVLFPILLWWNFYLYINKKHTYKTITSTIVMVLYTTLIVGSIFLATGKSGVDVYGAHISYQLRIKEFLTMIPTLISKYYLAFPLLIAAFASFKILLAGILYDKNKMLIQQAALFVIYILVALMVIASQYIFYNNQIPSNWRYDFPVMLMYPLIHFFAIKILLIYLSRFQNSELPTCLLYLLILLVLGSEVFKTGFGHIHKAATLNSQITNKFHNEVLLLKNSNLISSETKIVISSEQYIDFEAISSISRYLNYYTSHGPIMLSYQPQEGELSELAIILQKRLVDVEEGRNGNDGFFDLFSRYEVPTTNCISIVVGLAKHPLQCPKVANF